MRYIASVVLGRKALLISMLAIVVLLFAIACGKKEANSQSSAPNVSAPTTNPQPTAPVDQMKQFTKNLDKYYNVDHEGDVKGQLSFLAADISYDVQQTASLVSPYTGYIRYQKIVIDAKGVMPKLKQEHEIDFAYQENQWVIKAYNYRCFNRHSESWEEWKPYGSDPQVAKFELGMK